MSIKTDDETNECINEISADEKKSLHSKIKKAMHIRNREFSATETRYVDSWISMGFGQEAVAIAYEKSIAKTGKLTWPYIDAVLSEWQKKDLLTADAILESERMPHP